MTLKMKGGSSHGLKYAINLN
jgi:Mitochondrial calcium uniporter